MGGKISNPNESSFVTYNVPEQYSPRDFTPPTRNDSLEDFSGKGCNINFDDIYQFNFNFDLELGLDLNLGLDSKQDIDLSLFQKIDQLSLEIAKINNMMIDVLECLMDCNNPYAKEMAYTYNHVVVPVLRFFADHPDTSDCGDGTQGCRFRAKPNLINLVIDFITVIIVFKEVVEPLENLLVRVLPGNPWMPGRDIDPLVWIYGLYRKSGPYLEKLTSGDVLNPIHNTIKDVGQKMQVCIPQCSKDFNKTEFNYGNTKTIKPYIQEATLRIKENKGDRFRIEKPIAPSKPIASNYNNVGDYEKAKIKYDREYKDYESKLQSTNNFKAKMQVKVDADDMLKSYNDFIFESEIATNLINKELKSLCRCLSHFIDLKNSNVSTEIHYVRYREDLEFLVGKELLKTNRQLKINTDLKEANKKAILNESHLKNNSDVKNFLNNIDNPHKAIDVNISNLSKNVNNVYKNTIDSPDKVDYTSNSINKISRKYEPYEILLLNEKLLKLKKKIGKENSIFKGNLSLYNKLNSKNFNDMRSNAEDYLKKNPNLEAQRLYDNYFKSYVPFNLENEPVDLVQRNFYKNPDLYINEHKKSIQRFINSQIEERFKYFSEVLVMYKKRSDNNELISQINNILLENTVAKVEYKAINSAECKIDNLVCLLVQMIVSKLMGTLSGLEIQLANIVKEVVIPDWVKDLTELVMEFVVLFNSVLNLKSKFDLILDSRAALLDIIRGRIKTLPFNNSACLEKYIDEKENELVTDDNPYDKIPSDEDKDKIDETGNEDDEIIIDNIFEPDDDIIGGPVPVPITPVPVVPNDPTPDDPNDPIIPGPVPPPIITPDEPEPTPPDSDIDINNDCETSKTLKIKRNQITPNYNLIINEDVTRVIDGYEFNCT